MGIVNAALLSKNLERLNRLAEDFSPETIASAARDRTGNSAITPAAIENFIEIGNLASQKMLISAKQERRLRTFARELTDEALKAAQEHPAKDEVEK
jgi:hypothetical protein